MRQTPAFAVVVKGGKGAEGGAVEDEADVSLPGPLDEVGAEVDDAFAEVLWGDFVALDDFAGDGISDEDRSGLRGRCPRRSGR